MLGVLQGIIDLYSDQQSIQPDLKWTNFIDKFIIILIADGYKNLKSDFKAKAKALGIFDEAALVPFIKKIEHSNNKEELKNIFEIKELIKVKLETED